MNDDLISRDALKEDITLLTAYRYEPLSTEDIIDIIDNEVTKMNNDLISRSALKEEFLKYKPYAVDFLSLIDNAPTVEVPTELCKDCRFLKDCETCEEKLRPQGECEKCDYYTFAKAFINGIVEVMSKNGITTIEELLELLRGGKE